MSKKETVYFKRNKYRSEDFLVNDLPLTRRAQFFDILKHEWKSLLLIGFFLFLFSIPYLTIDILHWFIKINLPAQLESNGYTKEQIIQALQYTEMLYELLLVPATLIVIIPIAGAARVLKRMVHGEGVLFKADFLEGIKLNILHYLLLTLFYALLRFISQFIYIYIGNLVLSEIVRGVSAGILFGLFVPILLFMFAQDAIYKLNLWINFKNSAQLTIRSILVMWVFSLLIFSVYFLRLVQNIILKEAICTILILVFVPWYLLALSLYTMSRFDIFINQEHYKEFYRKGLRPYDVTHQTNDL